MLTNLGLIYASPIEIVLTLHAVPFDDISLQCFLPLDLHIKPRLNEISFYSISSLYNIPDVGDMLNREPSQQHRSVFRATAMRHYAHAREEVVLPQMLRPRSFSFLWIILVLVGILGVLTSRTSIPQMASGTAIVLEKTSSFCVLAEGACLALILHADQLPHLRPGQRVLVRLATKEASIGSNVANVEDTAWSPQSVQRAFGLNAADQPSAVAIAPFKLTEKNPLSENQYYGSVLEAEIEIGSQSLLSFIPFMGVIAR